VRDSQKIAEKMQWKGGGEVGNWQN